MSTKSQIMKNLNWTIVFLLIVIAAFIALFPFLWMILTSFKSDSEINLLPPTILPKEWHFENYVEAWNKPKSTFAQYFFNTLIVAGFGTIIQLMVTIPLAFALTHYEFKGRNTIFLLIIATMMIPFDITVIPNFFIIRHLPFVGGNNIFGQGGQGFYDHYLGIMLPYFADAFSVFLLRQAFLSVPKDYWEAAQIDGMSSFRYMTRVLVPLSTTAVITAGLFAFIGKWNGVLWPLLITSSESIRPLQVGLLYFVSEEGPKYGHLMAAATFTILPIVVLYLVLQKWFHEGISATGLKG